jgi:magnesium transporter
MDVYSITDAAVERRPAEELKVLLEQPDVLIWVDMPTCMTPDATVLSDLFGFHELAVRDCVERNHISKIHFYDDHVFTVLHAPLGLAGLYTVNRIGTTPGRSTADDPISHG